MRPFTSQMFSDARATPKVLRLPFLLPVPSLQSLPVSRVGPEEWKNS